MNININIQTQARAASLKHRVVSTYSVKRDGVFQNLEGPLIVPGDVVFLKGGQIVPADCQYLEGSVLSVRMSQSSLLITA